jgi:hypothetical protein
MNRSARMLVKKLMERMNRAMHDADIRDATVR